MANLWVLAGDHEAVGWNVLRQDYEAETLDIIHLDPHVWAIVERDEAPDGYEGLRAEPVQDGVYIDPNGSPLYVAGGRIMAGPQQVLEALGAEALATAERVGDPDRALEALGRVF